MSQTPETVETMPLTVKTADAQNEILLLDSRGRMVARGFGPVQTFQVEQGIYRVKVLTGAESVEKTVIANAPPLAPVEFQATPFATPVPISGTLTSHEYHQAAASEQCKKTHVADGHGSSLFFFIRDWTPSSRQSGPRVSNNPADGLSLHQVGVAGDRKICDLADAGEHSMSADCWAACTIDVAPGVYELRLVLPSGDVLHQSMVATADRQTQAFTFVRGYREGNRNAPPSTWRADLAKTSVVLSRDKSFSPQEPLLRLDELARVALGARNPNEAAATGRPLVPDEIRQMLRQKQYNPILGIYGAHLLLMEREVDMVLVREVVMNLQAFLGESHPDVAALALRAQLNPAPPPFEQPPMLRRSWLIVADASVERPALIAKVLEDRDTTDFVREGPWYIWRTTEQGDEAQLSALEEAMAEDLGVMKKVRERKYASGSGNAGEMPALRAPAPIAAAPDSAPADIPDIDESRMRQMVRRYGVSASKVNRAIDSLRSKKY